MSEKGESSQKGGILERLVPALLVISVLLAFGLGYLFKEVSDLKKGGGAAVDTTAAGAPVQPVQLSQDQVKDAFNKSAVKFGKDSAKTLFIEVADPSCPFCHIATGKNPELAVQVGPNFKYVSDGGTYVPPVPEMKKLLDKGEASYAFIYRNGHGNGEMGTKALYCANDQGKFWEVHDKLYTNAGYELLNNVVLNDKAKSNELVDFIGSAADAGKLKECLNSGKYDKRLAEDEALAGDLGVSGTPGFYINTTNFAGAYNWEEMKSSI